MIFEKRNVLDNAEQRERFEKEAWDALTQHYRRPIAILFSWQSGGNPNTIDLRAAPEDLDDASLHGMW